MRKFGEVVAQLLSAIVAWVVGLGTVGFAILVTGLLFTFLFPPLGIIILIGFMVYAFFSLIYFIIQALRTDLEI